jgi:hypothetical protein
MTAMTLVQYSIYTVLVPVCPLPGNVVVVAYVVC